MKYKQNLHTHTNYVDGKDSPEELVLEAIARGFDSLGFSEHTYVKYIDEDGQLTPTKMEEYKAEINALKEKYKGTIDIFCGLEYDNVSELDTTGYDYLLGSVHRINYSFDTARTDRNLSVTMGLMRGLYNGTALEFAKTYFADVASLPDKKNIDIIGHFDLLIKNNPKAKFIDASSREYLSLGYEAIHALKGRVPFFEVNTGAIARSGGKTPYPQYEFLCELRKCGFGAVITSDCHSKKYLDCYFDGAREYLASAGFRSKWVLTPSGFKEIEL